jgi:hypothetical protein
MAYALEIVQQLFPEVTSVVDAKSDVMVEVSDRDINSATVRDHKACALAVACKKKFKADGVIISLSRAYLIQGKKATRFSVPAAVAREIVVFDRDGKFLAGEYSLNAVSKAAKLGVGHGNKSKNASKKKGGIAKRFARHTGGIRAALGSN